MRERFAQIRSAFEQTRAVDPRLVPYLIAAALGALLVPMLVGLLLGGPIGGLIVGLLLAPLATMIVFSRRVQSAQYGALEGQAGAAAAVLQTLRGAWWLTPVVAFNRKQDLVHRVVGPPGVVLVGEGSTAGVKSLMKAEARKMRRAVPEDVPVHTILVGHGEGRVELRELRMKVMKLPRRLKKKNVAALETRVSALSDTARPIPGGPMPRSPRAGGRPR